MKDAHTTEDLTEYGARRPAQVIAHTNLYWANHAAPGRTAAVADTAELASTGLTNTVPCDHRCRGSARRLRAWAWIRPTT